MITNSRLETLTNTDLTETAIDEMSRVSLEDTRIQPDALEQLTTGVDVEIGYEMHNMGELSLFYIIS